MQRRSTIKANPKGPRFTYKKYLVGHNASPSVMTGFQRHILYEIIYGEKKPGKGGLKWHYR